MATIRSAGIDLGRYAASQIELLPREEVGGFAYTALVATFRRLLLAHDCDLDVDDCPMCVELRTGDWIVEAFEARIGPAPEEMAVPRQRAEPASSS